MSNCQQTNIQKQPIEISAINSAVADQYFTAAFILIKQIQKFHNDIYPSFISFTDFAG